MTDVGVSSRIDLTRMKYMNASQRRKHRRRRRRRRRFVNANTMIDMFENYWFQPLKSTVFLS
jgi:hypothetical protein